MLNQLHYTRHNNQPDNYRTCYTRHIQYPAQRQQPPEHPNQQRQHKPPTHRSQQHPTHHQKPLPRRLMNPYQRKRAHEHKQRQRIRYRQEKRRHEILPQPTQLTRPPNKTLPTHLQMRLRQHHPNTQKYQHRRPGYEQRRPMSLNKIRNHRHTKPRHNSIQKIRRRRATTTRKTRTPTHSQRPLYAQHTNRTQRYRRHKADRNTLYQRTDVSYHLKLHLCHTFKRTRIY